MTDHEIVWEFQQDYVTANAVCTAAADASCRNLPKCDCETWPDLQRDEKGWFHTYEDYVTGDETVTVKHRHTRPADYCNICEWLNASDLLECAEGRISFEIARTPIETPWEGDYYEWKPA